MSRFDQFVGGSYTLGSVTAESQQALNEYPELVESGAGKNKYRYVGTPGLEFFCDMTGIDRYATPIRGIWSNADRLFVAAGSKIMELDSTGALVGSVYSIPAGVSPVQIFSNGNQLLIISEGLAYIWNPPAGPVQATLTPSAANLTAVTGAYLDGYFIVQRGSLAGDSKQFNISALLDGTTWDDLDFDNKSGHPDNIIGILADHGELWLFGSETTEVWRDTGAADFPFQRDPGAMIHQGCIAPWSPVSIGGMVGWIGADSRGGPVAYLAQGFQPTRVSNHAVEEAWRSVAFAMSSATSFAYQEAGHWFWVISLPGTRTWVYDINTQLWHERGLLTAGGSVVSAHYQFHTYIPGWGASGEHIVGNYGYVESGSLTPHGGKLYKMSLSNYSDAGTDIRRSRTAPHIVNEQKRISYHSIQFDMETGPQIGGTVAPVVELSWSDDGGQTYNTPRVSGDIRAATNTRVIHRQLGSGRDRVFRLDITGQSKVAINNAYLNTSENDS